MGRLGAGSTGPTYGDFEIADEALAGLRALAAERVGGGSGDDELSCGGSFERRAQARRLERDWRPCEDVLFLPRAPRDDRTRLGSPAASKGQSPD